MWQVYDKFNVKFFLRTFANTTKDFCKMTPVGQLASIEVRCFNGDVSTSK
jgi:hypothetical protein